MDCVVCLLTEENKQVSTIIYRANYAIKVRENTLNYDIIQARQ